VKFAAIDIGSNAVKLLLARVLDNDTQPYFKKESFIRMPIRLGEDVFTNRRISEEQVEALLQAMAGFKNLIAAYGALDYMACATSAMREAENGEAIAAEIRNVTGIDLQIVDGSREAQIIYSNHAENSLGPDHPSLYVDVGGGSTEISFMNRGQCVDSRSFKIGTIRILKDLISDDDWQSMRSWLKEITGEAKSPAIIGSGGNINKVFRLARKKEGKPISPKKLKTIYKGLVSYTFDERIRLLGLRPDRADVIVPACEIFLSVMKWTGSDRLYVPLIGLSDGLIHILYEKQLQAASVGVS
jgi:exopolyphosphatase/guanosine-5'-triphosphate,3'-diphosphate pyrophosphatase